MTLTGPDVGGKVAPSWSKASLARARPGEPWGALLGSAAGCGEGCPEPGGVPGNSRCQPPRRTPVSCGPAARAAFQNLPFAFGLRGETGASPRALPSLPDKTRGPDPRQTPGFAAGGGDTRGGIREKGVTPFLWNGGRREERPAVARARPPREASCAGSARPSDPGRPLPAGSPAGQRAGRWGRPPLGWGFGGPAPCRSWSLNPSPTLHSVVSRKDLPEVEKHLDAVHTSLRPRPGCSAARPAAVASGGSPPLLARLLPSGWGSRRNTAFGNPLQWKEGRSPRDSPAGPSGVRPMPGSGREQPPLFRPRCQRGTHPSEGERCRVLFNRRAPVRPLLCDSGEA